MFRRVAYTCWESQQPSSDCTWSPCGEPRSCIAHSLRGSRDLAQSRQLTGNAGRNLLYPGLMALPSSAGCFYVTLERSFRSSSTERTPLTAPWEALHAPVSALHVSAGISAYFFLCKPKCHFFNNLLPISSISHCPDTRNSSFISNMTTRT